MWTVHEAAKELNYCEYQIRCLCRSGKLKARMEKHKWYIESLELPNQRGNRRRVITLNYLAALNPKTAVEQESIALVIAMITGNRHNPGVGVLRVQILTYLSEHETGNAREIAFYLKLKTHTVRVSMIRLLEQGLLTRVKMGIYAKSYT